MPSQTITHPELVAALVKPGSTIAAEMTPQGADLWHGATGVAGETGEILDCVFASVFHDTNLDVENMVEELGDMAFYLEQVRQNLGISRDETLSFVGDRPTLPLLDEAIMLSIAGSNLLDLAKKAVIYNKPVDREQMIVALSSIERVMESIRTHIGKTRDEVLAGNIAKLSVRYAGIKYSDTAAQVRADKA